MEEMNVLFQELLDKCNENGYSDSEIETIKKAYNYALQQHNDMKRKNGDIYISHPLNVALIVAGLNVDATTVISALVHETIDHGNASFEELEELFGSDVKDIVLSLTKVNRLHLVDDSESSSQYLRKVLVALAEDVRVLILKLAGRVHNLRTPEGLPIDLQKQKARETVNVLIPICHRLGINQIKTELEDLSYRILKPEIFETIEEELPAPREELNENLHAVMDDISDLIRSNGIKFEIKCRVKSNSSISNKLSKGKTWNNIYDILGIRIICDEIPDCYQIIGLIHSKYRPIPKRFKDYIAMPKGNSYQSLHTGIYGPNTLPIEVQVRTKEMNEIAEHGVASHWSYKEHGTKHASLVMEQKLEMFRNTIDASSDEIKDDEAFIGSVSSELLSRSIYVNTPQGDVMELPVDATPIDFAYRIHSKVGDMTVGALVNNQIVPLDYKLQDGDIVKIMTDQNSTPNKDWINFVKTTQAKSKIKAYFSKKDREEYISRGKDLLEKELRKKKIAIADALSDDKKNKLISDLHVTNFDEVLLSIGSLRYTPIYIINLIYQEKGEVEDPFIDKVLNNTASIKTNYKNDVIVSGFDDILVNLASCCKPVLGDEIVGYITKGQGINVHKKDCINIIDVRDRRIDVSWNEEKHSDDRKYVARLRVYTTGIDIDLTSIVAKATTRNVNISSINEQKHGEQSYYDLIIRVKSKVDLDQFINDLQSISFVTNVRRH